jgi:threonine/homoserine/homoserine lactone efflux protein
VAEAIGQSLLFAVAIAVFPIPIIATVILVLARRGRVLASLFALGWIIGLAALGAVVLTLVTAAEGGATATPTWVSWARVVLGTGLLGLAAVEARTQVRSRGRPRTPGWMQALEAVSPLRAAGTGLVLSALNPKNVALALAAGAAIVDVHLPAAQVVVVWAVFTVVASLGVLVPLGAVALLGRRAARPLGAFRGWLQANSSAILAVLFVLLGAKVIGDGIAGL